MVSCRLQRLLGTPRAGGVLHMPPAAILPPSLPPETSLQKALGTAHCNLPVLKGGCLKEGSSFLQQTVTGHCFF